MRKQYIIPKVKFMDFGSLQLLTSSSLKVYDQEDSPIVESSNQVFSRRESEGFEENDDYE